MHSIARDNVLRMPTPITTALKLSIRQEFVLDPDRIASEAMVQMRRAVGYARYGRRFDELTLEERAEIADDVNAAWYALLALLNGEATPMPAWEYRCLTFSGEYDPALLTLPATGTES